MTAAALGALLWPIYRRGGPESPPMAAGDAELAVYRDQLAEIDRDAARGLIDTQEAEAAHNEVSRRMLAAAGNRNAQPPVARAGAQRAAAVAALVGIPVVALSTYLAFGRPDLPGLPWSERMATAIERSDYDAMVAQVEAHLADNPSDAQGWLVLAPAYRGMGRYGEAADAYARVLALVPATPELLTDFGETLVLAEEGVVSAKAREAFQQALAADPGNAKALFYRALADRQDGRHEQALATWRTMLDGAPADAPWRPQVEHQMASLEFEVSGAPQIGDDATAKAGDLPADDQDAMIRGMVDRLAQRLERDGQDLQGWLRLAQARSVLGDREAAVAALRTAEHHFRGNRKALGKIDRTRAELGLGGNGGEAAP